MRFIPDFYSITFDEAEYKKALLNKMRELNERAGSAWIDTAVNKTPIPTWSGASRATFQKLAKELGTSVPIGPIVADKNRVSLGRSSSSGSGVVEDRKNFYIGFNYETDLRYLRYNEYHHATAGPPPRPFSNAVRFTPYKFQEKAEQAWRKEAKDAKAPNPLPYLHKRKM